MKTNHNCPFCGAEPHIGEDYISCSGDCIMNAIPMTHDEWNSRPPHPLEKKVEVFRDKIIEMFEYDLPDIDIRDIELEYENLFGEEE